MTTRRIRRRIASLGILALSLGAAAERSEAGAWVLPQGRSYFQIKLMHQDTEERYFLEGERIPYFFEGRNRTTALIVDYDRGLWKRLEGSIQVPVFNLRFDDLADERSSTDLGDVRVGLRYGIMQDPLVATLGFKVKLPTGDFENDAEVVPVGEGQLDYEFTLELGRSLWPRPGYVSAMIGYRLRTPNEESGINHGDELFWSAEGGYEPLPWLMLKFLARGLHGEPGTSFGLEIPTLRREAVYLEPGLIFKVGAGRAVEVSIPFTVRGRNWPAGPVLSLGVSQRF